MPDETRHYSTLSDVSPIQAKLILALAQGETVTRAAQSAGLHRSTVYEWLNKDKAFASALAHARQEYVQTLQDEMRELSTRALATLRQLLESPETPAPVRLRAALAVLERPRFPNQGWNLPEPLNTPQEEEFLRNYAVLESEYEASRMEEALQRRETETPESAPPTRTTHDPQPATPSRSAPCPCGSGRKYKRCCGVNAPPARFSVPFHDPGRCHGQPQSDRSPLGHA